MTPAMLILGGCWLIAVGLALVTANHSHRGRQRWPDGYTHEWVQILFLGVGVIMLAGGLLGAPGDTRPLGPPDSTTGATQSTELQVEPRKEYEINLPKGVDPNAE